MKSTALHIPICALAIMLISGCASGPRFAPSARAPGKSLVYFFEAPRFAGGARHYKLIVNGRYIANIGQGQYFDYQTGPQSVVVGLDLKPMFVPGMIVEGIVYGFAVGEKPALSFVAKPDSVYYAELSFEDGYDHPKFKLVDESTAIPTLTKCKRSGSVQQADAPND